MLNNVFWPFISFEVYFVGGWGLIQACSSRASLPGVRVSTWGMNDSDGLERQHGTFVRTKPDVSGARRTWVLGTSMNPGPYLGCPPSGGCHSWEVT